LKLPSGVSNLPNTRDSRFCRLHLVFWLLATPPCSTTQLISQQLVRLVPLLPPTSIIRFPRVNRDYGIYHKVVPTGSSLRLEPQMLSYFRCRLSRETRLQFNCSKEDRSLLLFTQAHGLSCLLF
jgi:hypothetical protein